MDIFSMGFRIIIAMVALPFLGCVVLVNVAVVIIDYVSIRKSQFPEKVRDEFVGARKRLIVWTIVFAVVLAYFLGSLAFVLMS